MLATCRFEC